MAAEGLGFSQPGESLQRKARAWRIYTDQHGRKFGAQAEIVNGMPVGELIPQGFSPPWQPNMEFAKFAKEHDVTFRWDYLEMANRLGGMTAAYYQDAVKFALENNKPEPEVGGPVDRSIRYVLGIPPLSPAIPLACELGDPWILGEPNAPVNTMLKAILEQTAGANAKEALEAIMTSLKEKIGESGIAAIPSLAPIAQVKEAVRTIHDQAPIEMDEITYQDFLRECKGRKMKMPDIVAAWNEHKKNLAESVEQVA